MIHDGCQHLSPPSLASGIAASPNPDAQHHLLARHLPQLLPSIDRALGGSHRQAALQPPAATPPADPSGGLAGGVTATTLQWLQIYSEVTSGVRVLALRGHAVGRYAHIERRCGKPMRASATPEGPLFAAWLVRFTRGPDGSVLPNAGVVAHVKGRYTAPARDCAWEVEASEADGAIALELVRRLASSEKTQEDGRGFEVDSLPDSAKTLQMVQRSSPELFAQLIRQAHAS